MSIVLDGTSGLTTNSGTLISASTIGVGAATPSASGAGITFPATQSASSNANTLDDYEEGTWTPVLGGTGGTSGQTYSTQTGTYTKVGKVVTCDCSLTLTVKGTIGTDLVLQGFPFGMPLGATLTVGLFRNWVGNKTFMSGVLGGGAGVTRLYITFATAATTYMDTGSTADVANNSQLIASITYTET